MILSKELYDHSCSSYKKIIDELEQKLAATQNEKEIVRIVMKFSRSFLTPKSYWDCCFENIGRVTPYHLCNDNCEVDCTFWEKVCYGAIERAYFHLHYDDKWDGLCFEGQMELYEDKYLKLTDFQYADDLEGCCF
uniref:Uncharacterized protein n=1 Tax=Panagrolaimus davidi TaxID=227884 RepID=A0A914PUI9_9BILA